MKHQMSCKDARDLLLGIARPVGTEKVPLAQCGGRVLAADLTAAEDVPAFDRSPYDGYALRAADTADASGNHPVTLTVIEEIPAGSSPTRAVTAGTAIKVLTGAPIPDGADVVVKYEDTEFTPDQVTIFAPLRTGDNITRAGEDVKQGALLAPAGTVIDCGLAGSLAAQGITEPLVYRRPVVGLISTGSELLEPGEAPQPGKIYNSNRYSFTALLERLGCEVRQFGVTVDDASVIAQRIASSLTICDAILLTGGVSVGDYDLTPAAMELAGAEVLCRGVEIKPGMACAYGQKDGKLICGLSGNPASSATNFYAVVMPAVKKLCGRRDYLPAEFPVVLAGRFKKKSPVTRLLRGNLDLSGGTVKMHISPNQGNAVLSSAIGCDIMAVVPAGSGPLEAGTILKGFLL